jgi:pilus assembly protein Flp/PilA
MKNLITRFVREEEGQDLIEYALIATFVSLAAAVGATALGTSLNNWYTAVSGSVDTMAGNVP